MVGKHAPNSIFLIDFYSPANVTSRFMGEQVREKIVENFRERMQLRRSLIELEDQNVQNSIEVKASYIIIVLKVGRGRKTRRLK